MDIVERSRRIRGEGSFAQRADGLWVGTVDLGWQGGRRVRKSVSGMVMKEARRKFKDLQGDVERGVVKAGSAMTVETWLNHWLDTIASERVRPRTLMGYRSNVNVWLIPQLGRHRLNKLSEDHVRALYRVMKKQGKSDATRRQVHAILRRALVVAQREGRVARNVAANVDPPPVGRNHRTPLTHDQATTVLNGLEGNPLIARWTAALMLGMRQGECLGLRWEDIDFEAGMISVQHELLRIKGEGLVLGLPKSKTSIRKLPMLAAMAHALAVTEHRGEYVFYGVAKDPRADYQAWKDLLVATGVCEPRLKLSEMPELACARTTTGTLLRDAGIADTVSRDIMSHSQVQVTQEYYQRTDAATMRAAMVALSESVSQQAHG